MVDRTPSCIRMAEVGVLDVLPDHLWRRTASVGHQVIGPYGSDDVADGIQDQLGLVVLDVVAAVGGDHQPASGDQLGQLTLQLLPQPLDHAEVLATTRRVRGEFTALLEGVIERL